MKKLLALSFSFGLLVLLLSENSVLLAQDKKVPDVEAAPVPAAPNDNEYATEAPTTGLIKAAGTGNAVLVTPKGGFAIPFVQGKKGCTAFEFGGRGFDSPQTYRGYQSNFHYWKIDLWQIIVAVRNTPTGGKFDVYFFINGSSIPVFYSQGVPYPSP